MHQSPNRFVPTPNGRLGLWFRAIVGNRPVSFGPGPLEDAVMLRICLCLLIVVASTTVAAREIKLSSPNGGSCPDAAAAMEREPATRTATRTSAPAPAVKSSKPVLHSDATNSGRMQSPRWHSFLPGMFR